MRPNINKYIADYETYHWHKFKTFVAVNLLQPLPSSEHIWFELSIDFIDALPPYFGYTVIMIVVNYLCKVTHFVALKHLYNATTMA